MGKQRKVTVRERVECIQFSFWWNEKQRFEALRLPPTPRNLKTAQNIAKRMAADLSSGTFDYAEYFPDSHNASCSHTDRPSTFRRLGERYLSELERAESTLKKYRGQLERIWYPLWEDRAVQTIKSAEIQQEVSNIKWHDNKARNDALTPLRGLFRKAKRAKWISDDPTEDIDHLDHQFGLPAPLSAEEALAVIADISEKEGGQWGAHFGFAFFSCLRPSEQYALSHEDWDKELQVVEVNKAWTELGLVPTKEREARSVELSDQALHYLELASSFSEGNERIFTHRDGRQIKTGKTRRQIWDAALLRLKIKHRPSYNTRSTGITMQIMAAANIWWIAEQAGNSVLVIEKNYGKWIRGRDKNKERSKIDTFIEGVKG